MKKIYVGIDISKEKCNLCYRDGLEIVMEEESANDVKALKKSLSAVLKMYEDSLKKAGSRNHFQPPSHLYIGHIFFRMIIFAAVMAKENIYLASKPRYEILDGLRGVAAIMVIIFHLLETYSAGPAFQIINHGYLAVISSSFSPVSSSAMPMMTDGKR